MCCEVERGGAADIKSSSKKGRYEHSSFLWTHSNACKLIPSPLFPFQFWSAYVPCDSQYKDAVRQTLEQIDVVHRMCQEYPETFMFATSADGELTRLTKNI